jgi:flagellar basal-body rod modification protein FlgD
MSIASVAAQQTQPAATSSGSASSSANALDSLTSNFNDFLSLLTTQLQNQDPSSPMDTNQFTSELVEFAGVEQQINTNADLSQMVSLTQAGQILQSASIVGKQVLVTSTQMPLQQGQAELQFTSTTAATTNITITNAAGATVLSTNVAANAGSNSWSWNGQDANGNQQADGAYTVTVTQANGTSTPTSVPFNVLGTATGVAKNGADVDLQMGAVSVPFSDIQSVQTATN